MRRSRHQADSVLMDWLIRRQCRLDDSMPMFPLSDAYRACWAPDGM